MWGYLSEFWGSVASSTLNAWEYTEDWFYNIGNAVAGAVGNLFYNALHILNDGTIFWGWILNLMKEMTLMWVQPLYYIFAFLKAFFLNAFKSPVEFSQYEIPADILAIFQAIPLWNEMMIALGVGLSIILVFYIFNLLHKT